MKSNDADSSQIVEIKGEKFTESEVNDIILNNSRNVTFSPSQFFLAFLYHFLFFYMWLFGLLIAAIIEYCLVGNINLLRNQRFTKTRTFIDKSQHIYATLIMALAVYTYLAMI